MTHCINCPKKIPSSSNGNWLAEGNVGPFCDVCWQAIHGGLAGRVAALGAIHAEREYQERRWPGPEHKHEVECYLVYIRHYLRKAEDITSTIDCTQHLNKLKVMDTVRKIAALAIAAMEQHGVVHREQNARL